MTTTEHAAAIRKELKARHGWTSRQVSVRAEHYSMGSSLHVVVKDPSIPLRAVKAIAGQAESIRRCEVTGEILSGGNRYVHVRYSSDAQEAHAARFFEPVSQALEGLEAGSNRLASIAGTAFAVGRPSEHRFTLWGESSYLTDCGSTLGLARAIGALVVEQEAGR